MYECLDFREARQYGTVVFMQIACDDANLLSPSELFQTIEVPRDHSYGMPTQQQGRHHMSSHKARGPRDHDVHARIAIFGTATTNCPPHDVTAPPCCLMISSERFQGRTTIQSGCLAAS